MKVVIIGSGAMGCLFGGLLSEKDQDVYLLDVWQEHVDALNSKGLSLSWKATKRTIRVKATTDPDAVANADLALIFVKHAHTEEAAKIARSILGDSGTILTLQNGMGNAEIIAREIAGTKIRVICGTTAQGAMLLGPGQIQHSGIGPTVIGAWDAESGSVEEEIAALFSHCAIETSTAAHIVPILWNKLFANVGINAVTALTNIRNGELLDQEPTKKLVASAVKEALRVASALGIEVAEQALDNVFAIAEATGPNRSSMGQDVDACRQTEIDAINGYIVDRGEELGIEVPVNLCLLRLIKTLQSHY